MYDEHYPNKRFKNTLNFVNLHVKKHEKILDLGVINPFSEILTREGFQVQNTLGEDLDLDTTSITSSDADVTTAFEIFEHLLSPFTVLRDIPSTKLIASVPLRLWFAPAYRSSTDKWDRHFHEFEDWQFDWLLEKAGWNILDSQKWTNPTHKIGIRPLLRKITPRYYIIYAERIQK